MIYQILIETHCYEDWEKARKFFDNPKTTPMTQPYKYNIKASNAWRTVNANRDQEYIDEQLFLRLNS
tara:strand:+ start:568 stop:768 length:201 start_codon:yes stop_codon:yes gene_type:complete